MYFALKLDLNFFGPSFILYGTFFWTSGYVVPRRQGLSVLLPVHLFDQFLNFD